jgi:SNF2 family DNA or RNA helicase
LECGAAVSVKRKITQILRLHQVLQGFVRSDDGAIRYLKSNRIKALMEILDEATGKVVVWVTYEETLRAVADALEAEYGEGSVARFWGGNRATRHEDEARYLGDPRCRFQVATPGAGGLGNTWVVGQLAVYVSGTPDLEHRLQSEDRTHRDGQTGQATYQDIYVPGTVDERIMEINREKIDMATALLGDGYREWLRWN